MKVKVSVTLDDELVAFIDSQPGSTRSAKIEAALKDAEEALKGDDKARIEAATQALAQAAQKLAEQMFKEQQAQQPAGGEAGADAGAKKDEGDVVDAEYEEVKDGKK